MVAVCLMDKGYLAVDEMRVCVSRAWIRGKNNLRFFSTTHNVNNFCFSVTHKTLIFLWKV